MEPFKADALLPSFANVLIIVANMLNPTPWILLESVVDVIIIFNFSIIFILLKIKEPFGSSAIFCNVSKACNVEVSSKRFLDSLNIGIKTRIATLIFDLIAAVFPPALFKFAIVFV